MRDQYRGWQARAIALVILVPLLAPGCAVRKLQGALDRRIETLYAAPVDTPDNDRFGAGAALTVDAATELVRREILRTVDEQELESILLSDGPIPGMASVVFVPDWEALAVELREAPGRGPASIDLLAAIPGILTAEAGPLAVEQTVRVAARLPLELGARVLDEGGLSLVAVVSHPDAAQVSIQLPAFPPGTGALVSGAAQTALRDHLRQRPPEAEELTRIERLGPQPDLLALSGAVVRTFPGGQPTIFIGLQPDLPRIEPPAVDPAGLSPEEGEDWTLRVDQEVLALVLARLALAGHLGGSMIAPPDVPDLSHLHLDGTGFAAGIRIWRFRPPPGTYDLEVNGALSWNVDHLEIRVDSLEMEGKGELSRWSLPMRIPLPPTEMLWPLDRVDTIDGALVGGGRIPPRE